MPIKLQIKAVITSASTTLQQCVHTPPQVQINHIKLPNNVRKIKHFKAKPIAPEPRTQVSNDIKFTCITPCCIPPLSHTP